MATASNSKSVRIAAPVLVGHTYRPVTTSSDMWRLLPAALISAIFHGCLMGAVVLYSLFVLPGQTQATPNLVTEPEATVEAPAADNDLPPESSNPLQNPDVDPANTDPDAQINYNNSRIDEVSVPGIVDNDQPIGIKDGDKNAPPMNIAAPPGFGGGQGGALDIKDAVGNSNDVGTAGGIGGLRGAKLAGTFYGRSGSTREKSLREGGGTSESEAAVARGLKWLEKQQAPNGSWPLDGTFKDRGQKNDIAGTAFGLLPFLGAGYTHKAAKNAKNNPYEKPIEKGLRFLIMKQDKRTGNFGGETLYAHALATIAMCEAYGLSQDPALKAPSQRAINFLVSGQHAGGGWRYHPGESGDLSVTGWVVMALKSGMMAGLDVPERTMRQAIYFVDSCNDQSNEGYFYHPQENKQVTPTRSAIGLLCRQYLQNWGPNNLHMIKGVENNIKSVPPQPNYPDMYYYYYATQVMHHLWGEGWKKWNEKMRPMLVASQDKSPGALNGSWSPVGDAWCSRGGGRLMMTSLCILTLEVYYRHLPLYYRDTGERRVAGKN